MSKTTAITPGELGALAKTLDMLNCPCSADQIRQVADQIGDLQERIAALEAALAEAMCVRHYCGMEGDLDGTRDTPERPYEFDEFLRRWAEALGRRVYSAWPTSDRERTVP